MLSYLFTFALSLFFHIEQNTCLLHASIEISTQGYVIPHYIIL